MGERKLICIIYISDLIDIKASDYVIRDIKNKETSNIARVKFMISPFELEKYCNFSVDNEDLGYASVYATKRIKKELTEEELNMIYKYSSHKFPNKKEIEELKKAISEAGPYLVDCRLTPVNEETASEIIEKVSKEASEHILTAFSAVSKEVERLKKEFSKIGPELKFELPAVNEETEDNEKDFEYICDRCGGKVKTPNTLRGPVNVVDFYREVEDEVGDSVSYRLCQECMQDFFGFLSCN